MELGDAIRRRRMCRSFTDEPVDPTSVDRILDLARRAPSAGHTQGWAWLVLEGEEQTSQFWSLDADPEWLAAPTHPGLLRAPVILIPFSSPDLYRSRYTEADKAARRRPGGALASPAAADWPIPWWDVDLAFAVMLVLLGVAGEGLGALFFALHGDPHALAAGFGVPAEWRPLGAIALGWPAADATSSPSATRGRRTIDQVVHRGQW
jgi:nitroreductase